MFTIFAVCILLALCFGVAWFHTGGASPAIATVTWLLYPLYEVWYQSRCTGECNIRVDLVLIAAFLLVVSVLAVTSLVRGTLRKRRHSDESV